MRLSVSLRGFLHCVLDHYHVDIGNFHRRFGHSSGFYSCATDEAGNHPADAVVRAEASTSLQATTAPVATGQSVVAGENDAKAEHPRPAIPPAIP